MENFYTFTTNEYRAFNLDLAIILVDAGIKAEITKPFN